MTRARIGLVAAAVVAVTALGAGGIAAANASGSDHGDKARMGAETIPTTPSVATDMGVVEHGVRVFRLTAMQFTQQIATFPVKTAKVWGWKVTGAADATASTPGPTLVAYAGDQIQFVVTNNLPEPTSLHPHGTGEPNNADGVAGIDFAPIQPGDTYTYPAYVTPHAGTFAYHSHTDTNVQEPRGLVGLITVLNRQVEASDNPQVDVGMTLQQFNPSDDGGLTVAEGGLTATQPNGRGQWPFSTINGKTGDAEGAPITVHPGDLVQIRLYNASGMVHSMHLHGADMTLVDVNGHPTTPTVVTTKSIAPGEFFTLRFRANNSGNWVFHCSFPSHQANNSMAGYQGAPVGMLRVFHYSNAPAVPAQYFGPPA